MNTIFSVLMKLIPEAVRVKDVALAVSVAREQVWPALVALYTLFTRPDDTPATTEAEVEVALRAALAPWSRVEQVAREELARAGAAPAPDGPVMGATRIHLVSDASTGDR